MSKADNISRRDFVRGQFFKALGAEAPASDSVSASPPDDSPTQPRPLVMRYPKSAEDVSAAGYYSEAPTSARAARRGSIPVLRPPGAVDEATFLAECTRCNECITACPHDAILHAPPRMREGAGTPMIDADRKPCRMCADFPCIAACEPDVLTALVPKAMGTAKVIAHTCLAYHGTTCTVCSEQCPEPGAFTVTEGKPTVNENVCTGCGVCRYVCPAPENAILLMPAFSRPKPTR